MKWIITVLLLIFYAKPIWYSLRVLYHAIMLGTKDVAKHTDSIEYYYNHLVSWLYSSWDLVKWRKEDL